MRQKIDLRGLTCPEPVLKAKQLLDDSQMETLEALVDDDVCVANLQRLSRSIKASTQVTEMDGYFQITIEKTSSSAQPSTNQVIQHQPLPTKNSKSVLTVIFLSKDYLGQGDEAFSQHLLNLFLQTVQQAGHCPQAILMANSGVKLIAKDSSVRKVLDDFQAAGCEVLACGLCLEFYGLKDQVPKEQITNMFAITEYLFAADKVLTP